MRAPARCVAWVLLAAGCGGVGGPARGTVAPGARMEIWVPRDDAAGTSDAPQVWVPRADVGKTTAAKQVRVPRKDAGGTIDDGPQVWVPREDAAGTSGVPQVWVPRSELRRR